MDLNDYHVAEYRELKKEQVRRIGFRDNLIYVMLGLFGAIVSFSLTVAQNNHGLLITPLVGLIIGWTYLNNDKKISQISLYIDDELGPRVNKNRVVFGWENTNKQNAGRGVDKFFQLCIDILTFSGTGALSLSLYKTLETVSFSHELYAISWAISILTAIVIIIYVE